MQVYDFTFLADAEGLLNLIPRLAQAAPVCFTCLFKVRAPAGLQHVKP